MKSSELQKLKELKLLFENLISILEAESEMNWMRTIKKLLNDIDNTIIDQNDVELRINKLSRCYKLINSGNGSFSDFYIWREDFQERLRENKKLDKIKDEIWKILNNH